MPMDPTDKVQSQDISMAMGNVRRHVRAHHTRTDAEFVLY